MTVSGELNPYKLEIDRTSTFLLPSSCPSSCFYFLNFFAIVLYDCALIKSPVGCLRLSIRQRLANTRTSTLAALIAVIAGIAEILVNVVMMIIGDPLRQCGLLEQSVVQYGTPTAYQAAANCRWLENLQRSLSSLPFVLFVVMMVAVLGFVAFRLIESDYTKKPSQEINSESQINLLSKCEHEYMKKSHKFLQQ